MSHYVSTKPFYILTGVPSPSGFFYNVNTVGSEIDAPDTYGLEEFDDEPTFAARVDELIGEPGWYYRCENRIPSPPNPVEWSYLDCIDSEP